MKTKLRKISIDRQTITEKKAESHENYTKSSLLTKKWVLIVIVTINTKFRFSLKSVDNSRNVKYV